MKLDMRSQQLYLALAIGVFTTFGIMLLLPPTRGAA